MKKLIWLSFVAVIGIYQVSASQNARKNTASPPSEKFSLLRDVLRDIGNKYDCYFTMEIGLVSGNHIYSLENVNSIDKRSFALEMQNRTLREVLELLQSSIPHLNYRYNRYNPKIIHIIDERLLRKKSYALEKIIGDISFEGKVSDLIDLIGQRGVAVSSRGAIDIYESMGVDYSTRVSVVKKKRSVRYILSNSLTLKDRGRVLWIAETELTEGQTTFVRFLREFA